MQHQVEMKCQVLEQIMTGSMPHVMQNGDVQPIAYASQKLTGPEQNYAQIEREALTIIFGVRRFHQCLYGRGFTLVTDHRPLCKILEKEGIPPPCSCKDATLGTNLECIPIQPPLAAARMQRWELILSAYQYNPPLQLQGCNVGN